MNKKQQEEFLETLDAHQVSFENKHGEVFNVHYPDGVIVMLSGDEIDMMVKDKDKILGKYIYLFNRHFNIWSKEELNKLGKALQELTDD